MDASKIAAGLRQDLAAIESSSKDALVALLLHHALQALAIIVFIGFVIGVPSFTANKKASAIVLLMMAVFMLLPSGVLLRTGRTTKAAWAFLISATVIMTLLVALSGGLHGQAVRQPAEAKAAEVASTGNHYKARILDRKVDALES